MYLKSHGVKSKTTTRKTRRPEPKKPNQTQQETVAQKKPVGVDSHGRPSRKHGFREASEKCRRGERRVCHCERCYTKTKTDDSQN